MINTNLPISRDNCHASIFCILQEIQKATRFNTNSFEEKPFNIKLFKRPWSLFIFCQTRNDAKNATTSPTITARSTNHFLCGPILIILHLESQIIESTNALFWATWKYFISTFESGRGRLALVTCPLKQRGLRSERKWRKNVEKKHKIERTFPYENSYFFAQ